MDPSSAMTRSALAAVVVRLRPSPLGWGGALVILHHEVPAGMAGASRWQNGVEPGASARHPWLHGAGQSPEQESKGRSGECGPGRKAAEVSKDLKIRVTGEDG